EEIDNKMLVHMHINSQGYNDGIILGGPGKFDIDHGARINGMNIVIAKLIQDYGFGRWKGHDMQVRPYDNETKAIERLIRSILSWETCEMVARKMNLEEILKYLSNRETDRVEDIMKDMVAQGFKIFKSLYEQT
ncbi:MAG: xylose isomerase, partial [Candidatus Omnitrophica bacterium]|nr:xylose isomerase [Candidatus Omnitrophota bacterium]